MHGIGFETKSAVLLNLTVSLVTPPFAMINRSGAVSLVAVVPHLPEVAGLALGVWRALFRCRLVRRLGQRLVQLIAFLLVGICGLLLRGAAFPFQYASLVPVSFTLHR